MQETRGAAPLLRRPSWARLTLVLALAGSALLVGRAGAADAPRPAGPVAYSRDVAPLLTRWCVSCHGEKEPEADLRLDSFEGLMRGGDAGPVVVPSDPDASLLVAKVERRHRPSMPPRRRLPATTVAIIRAWIAAGAPP